MPQSLVQVYLHLIWSTKHRAPFLKDPALRVEMHKYLGGACNGIGCPVLQVGGVEDHVHVLCRQGKSLTIPEILAELKRESSKWAKLRDPSLRDFYWQDGYGAFSYSRSQIDVVCEYVLNQEEHHKKQTFQEEYLNFLEKFAVLYDERYLFDFFD